MTLCIISIVVLLYVNAINSLSCDPCNPANCFEPTCAGNLVRDPCGCCRVCAKQELEECGGMFDMHGLCDKNLTCVIRASNGDFLTEHKPGICKNQLTDMDQCYEASFSGCNLVNGKCNCGQQVACSNPYQFQSQESCNQFRTKDTRKECVNVHCDIQQSRSCPSDSLLIEGFTPEGECCPTPSRCECKRYRCSYNLCPPLTRRVLVKPGSDRPGSCCDEYQCVPQGKEEDCRTVECSVSSLDSISCPQDSIAARNPLTSTVCCPGQPMCQCLMERCPFPPACPTGKTARVSYRGNEQPGSCCDEYVCASSRVFVGCLVNGTRHEHGTVYEMAKCQVCECSMGLSRCSLKPCPLLTCNDVTLEDGDCCPKCVHPDGLNPPCKSKDKDGLKTYAFGETWFTDDCTHCTCAKDGKSKCKAAFCQEPSTSPDVPSCSAFSHCPLYEKDCSLGYQYNDSLCRSCECRPEIWGCQPLTDCLITCPLGFVVDQSGCNTCRCRQKKCKELPKSCKKQCPYGYKQNKKNCERCKCRSCPAMNSCKKKCSLGWAHNTHGCSICKCKVETSNTTSIAPEPSHMCADPDTQSRRDDGEVWMSDNCHMCLCRGGDVMCDVIQCPVATCAKPVLKQGECCPSCNESIEPQKHRMLSCRIPNGDWLVEGETWSSDPCTTCTCHSGHVMCASKFCPPIPCEHPVYDQNLCCPKCPSEANPNLNSGQSCRLENGSIYESGSQFKTSPCTSCLCQNGVLKCFDEKCPVITSCSNPVIKRGQCCARCLGESPSLRPCVTDDETRMHAEEWNETSSACTTCMCVNGEIRCKKPVCPAVSSKCRRLYRRPGDCCEECVVNDAPKPSPPAYPSGGGNNQTVPIVLTVSFLFIFFVLVVGLALCIVRKRYPHVIQSIQSRLRFRHKYTAGTEQNQMTLRLSSSDKIGERSNSIEGGSSGTGHSDMTNFTTSSDEKALTQ